MIIKINTFGFQVGFSGRLYFGVVSRAELVGGPHSEAVRGVGIQLVDFQLSLD